MQQGLPPQEPQQPEIDTSKPSYDNAQMQQMLASNPELAQQVTESNVNAKRFLNS
jgi:hypothetical protein